MGQATRWEKIAREWNGKYYPAKGLGLEQKVVAARDGYLAVIGTTVRGGTGVGYVAIRFPRGGTWQSLPEAVVRDPGVLQGFGQALLPTRPPQAPEGRRRAPLVRAAVLPPGAAGAVGGPVHRLYRAPAGARGAVRRSLRSLHHRPCGGAAPGERRARVRLPGLSPGGGAGGGAGRASVRLADPRPALGLLAGVAAALGGGFAWALLAILTGRIFSALAIGIGVLVAYAVKAGMGKVNLPGQVLTGVLTLGGVFAGQIFYVAHLLQNRIGHYDFAVALQVYVKVLQAKPTAELTTLFFALIYVAANFLVDLCYVLADPRVRFAGGRR